MKRIILILFMKFFEKELENIFDEYPEIQIKFAELLKSYC